MVPSTVLSIVALSVPVCLFACSFMIAVIRERVPDVRRTPACQHDDPHELPSALSPSCVPDVSCAVCPFACWLSACARSASIFASIAVSWFSRAAAVCSPLASSWKAWRCQLDMLRDGALNVPWPDQQRQSRWHLRWLPACQMTLLCL